MNEQRFLHFFKEFNIGTKESADKSLLDLTEYRGWLCEMLQKQVSFERYAFDQDSAFLTGWNKMTGIEYYRARVFYWITRVLGLSTDNVEFQTLLEFLLFNKQPIPLPPPTKGQSSTMPRCPFARDRPQQHLSQSQLVDNIVWPAWVDLQKNQTAHSAGDETEKGDLTVVLASYIPDHCIQSLLTSKTGPIVIFAERSGTVRSNLGGHENLSLETDRWAAAVQIFANALHTLGKDAVGEAMAYLYQFQNSS